MAGRSLLAQLSKRNKVHHLFSVVLLVFRVTARAEIECANYVRLSVEKPWRLDSST